jgi:aspartyl protease family protein
MMGGAIALVIAIGVILLLVVQGDTPIGNFTPDEVAALVGVAAMTVVVLGWILQLGRSQWGKALQGVAVWVLMFSVVAALYTYRGEIAALSNRFFAEFAPGATETAEGGEVTVNRRGGGDFIVSGAINGRGARFLFDTGASAVVLTSETARAAGIDVDNLRYVHVVTTANGRALAAAVVLDRLSIGGISEARVHALVAKPGLLWQNLLGMTFLNRLASYEVRGDKLIMRGKDAVRSATR